MTQPDIDRIAREVCEAIGSTNGHGTVYAALMEVAGIYRPHDQIISAPHTEACDDGDINLMCPECQQAAEATRCQMCDGTGIYSDEDISVACPYCGATGEADL